MKVVEYGEENPDVILLLHGGGLAPWNYREEAELLKDKFHIVVPVLDGHSGSDREFISIEENAEKLIGYIDETFGGRVLLIGGLSLGGQILVEMLSQRKDICKFAIIDSAAIRKEDMIAFLRANSDYKMKDTLSDCQVNALVIVGGKEQGIMKKSAGIISGKMGDFSLNHAEEYAKKLLDLIGRKLPTIKNGKGVA